jgi:hypothetical protein
MPKKKKLRPEETPGFPLRIGISVLTFFGLLAFFVVWLFFYADSFTIYQNIAAIIVGLLVAVAIWAAAWVSWGIKYGECCDEDHDKKK